jgi:hypothetical protein
MHDGLEVGREALVFEKIENLRLAALIGGNIQ